MHPLDALDAILDAHPTATRRPGQDAMCAAIAQAVAARRHLLVEAGTGVGKSLAYLAAAAVHHGRVVVATATKALQEQLVTKDLPLVAAALEPQLGRPLRFAMLKGRGNYLCVAKAAAAADTLAGIAVVDELPADEALREEIAGLSWYAWTPGGDGDESAVGFPVSRAAWRQVSTDARECPGARDCAFGEVCLAEKARREALGADVIVVNTHLYALHLALEDGEGQGLLPAHDVVVIDEAHQLEDVAVSAFGVEVSGGRLRWLAGRLRRLVEASKAADALAAAADPLDDALRAAGGSQIDVHTGAVAEALAAAARAASRASAELAGISPGTEEAQSRHRMLARAVGSLVDDLDAVREPGPDDVAWAQDERERVALRVAPVEVGALLAPRLFARRTVILTSATLAVGGRFEPRALRLGLGEHDPLPAEPVDRTQYPPGDPPPDGADGENGDGGPAGDGDRDRDGPDDDPRPLPERLRWWSLAAQSPFDYAANTLLYCATDLPQPNSDAFAEAMTERLAALVDAAGGRTLALFTSRRAMERTAEALGHLVPYPLLVQDSMPRRLLVERFAAEEEACLLATIGFWQGLDVPGPTLSLVAIDRIPFPHPDDPLHRARRDLATRRRSSGFATVDVPHAATLLAQGAGRLVRSVEDRGVVAVLDRRFGTSRSYAWTLVRSLPPMPRTKDLAEAQAFLRALRTPAPV